MARALVGRIVVCTCGSVIVWLVASGILGGPAGIASAEIKASLAAMPQDVSKGLPRRLSRTFYWITWQTGV